MKEYGVEIVGYDDIKDKEDKKFLEHYFTQEMLPLVSPQVVSKDSHSLSLIMVNSIL